GDRYGQVFLTLVTGIVEVGYPHANDSDRSSKGGCQRLCQQVRCPCRDYQCRCQQSDGEFEGVPGVEHLSSSVRRRRRLFCPWLLRRGVARWGRRLLRERGRTIARHGWLTSMFKRFTWRIRVVTRRSCGFPFTMAHNI